MNFEEELTGIAEITDIKELDNRIKRYQDEYGEIEEELNGTTDIGKIKRLEDKKENYIQLIRACRRRREELERIEQENKEQKDKEESISFDEEVASITDTKKLSEMETENYVEADRIEAKIYEGMPMNEALMLIQEKDEYVRRAEACKSRIGELESAKEESFSEEFKETAEDPRTMIEVQETQKQVKGAVEETKEKQGDGKSFEEEIAGITDIEKLSSMVEDYRSEAGELQEKIDGLNMHDRRDVERYSELSKKMYDCRDKANACMRRIKQIEDKQEQYDR